MWDALRNKSPQPPLNPEKPSSPFCATVGFGLESANVVGYQYIEIPAGYNLFTPTFNGVVDELDVTTIAVCDADGNELDLFNDVTMQKMDDTGAYLDSIAYSPTFGGWNVDFTAIAEGDFVLQPGEAGCVGHESGAEVYFKLPSPIK